jgi:hypothetical protein
MKGASARAFSFRAAAVSSGWRGASAVGLARGLRAHRARICAAVAARLHIASLTLYDRWKHLLLRPRENLGTHARFSCSYPCR